METEEENLRSLDNDLLICLRGQFFTKMSAFRDCLKEWREKKGADFSW
jgi:hypothetical protein